ncbi:hypothetical protein VTO42DRAFT_2601 [Malbranchea cinnamomea]
MTFIEEHQNISMTSDALFTASWSPCTLTMDHVLKHAPTLVIVLDSYYRVCDVSQAYLDRFCIEAAHLLGRHVYEYFDADGDCQSVDTASISSVVEMAMTMRKVSAVRGILGKGHDPSTWDIRAVPLMDDSSCVTNVLLELEEQEASRPTSVTSSERKVRRNEQIFNMAETYRTLVETVRDYAIFMLDTKGCIVTWNLGAELMKGYKREEIIGRHFSTFYGLEDRLAHKPSRELKYSLRDGRFEDEGWRYRKDGHRFWANVIITPLYRDGVHIGFTKVTRDLTERKTNEIRLIAAYEESARLKSEFLANMSHEIRTPMHGMLAALDLLKDSKLDLAQLELVDILHDSGTVLVQVINNILDYSKISSGNVPILSDDIDIKEIIRSVTKSFQTTLRNRPLNLSTSLTADIPDVAKGDPLRYRQILQNLIDNAIKFTDKGEVVTSASVERADEHALVIRTEVADTGIGIPADSVESLFTPFTQLDGSTTKRYKGAGLGLSICKSLAELMGGSIGYLPNPKGYGSIFWFTTTLRKVQGQPKVKPGHGGVEVETTRGLEDGVSFLNLHNDGERKEEVSTPKTLSLDSEANPTIYLRSIACNKRILFVEDNALNQRVMRRTLATLGFNTVDVAWNGLEAVNLAGRYGNCYDLILMDISMPHMGGVTATAEIRKRGVQTPIVAMTANALTGQAESYLANGLNDYISKPVDKENFVKVLLKWLKSD